MAAGNIDRLVQFQRYAEEDDGFGMVELWTDYGAPVWASKRDVSDGERAAAGWIEATVVSRFLVRWSAFTSALTPADRLVCGGLAYEIIGIKEGDGRRRWLEITATGRNDLAVKPANVVVPVITGTAQVGETLAVSTGAWTGNPSPTYAYAWFADGVLIAGATAATYTLTGAEETKAITAKVTATNSAGSVTVETVATDAVLP